MSSISSFCKVGVVGAGFSAFLLCTPGSGAEKGDALPSQAETAIINSKIAAIRDPQDRAAVRKQSLVWKMTTFLCQNAARAPLKHLGAGDRFFLQDDRPNSQEMVSSSLLKGRGQFRQAADGISWTSFQWSCHLDPATGAVKSFDVTPVVNAAAPAPSSAPVCQAAHLDVKLDDRDGAFNGMSHSGTALVVRNTGPAVCTMPPMPLVHFEDKAGHKLSVIKDKASQAGQPVSHGAKTRQHAEAFVLLKPGAEQDITLRWVSGDVYDDSHNCVEPARLVLNIGPERKEVAFKGQMCAAAGAFQVFDQSALQAHTDTQ